MKTHRDVVVVSPELLKDMMALKKGGFLKTEIRSKEGNGYKLMPVDHVVAHPVIKKHRLMSENEYVQLLESIAETGQTEPVKMYRGRMVDGRHRYYALKDLGIKYIKYRDLPHSLTLQELESEVFSTEVRRHDSPAQKAAKAWLDYDKNGKSEKDGIRAYARKYGVSHGSISKMNTIAQHLGSAHIEELYYNGVTSVDGKFYKSIGPLYQKALSRQKDNNRDGTESLAYGIELTDEEKEIIKAIDRIADNEKLDVLGAIVKHAKRKIEKIIKDV